jgi:hypothetical protein
MDLSDAAHLLGMDLRPSDWYDDDPTPPYVTDEAVEALAADPRWPWMLPYDGDTEYPTIEDAFGTITTDVGNLEDYAPGGDHQLVIRYDTLTDLEARLIAMAVGQFIRSKTPAHNITTTYTKEG